MISKRTIEVGRTKPDDTVFIAFARESVEVIRAVFSGDTRVAACLSENDTRWLIVALAKELQASDVREIIDLLDDLIESDDAPLQGPNVDK